jgi:hypothetical protein
MTPLGAPFSNRGASIAQSIGRDQVVVDRQVIMARGRYFDLSEPLGFWPMAIESTSTTDMLKLISSFDRSKGYSIA